MIECDSSGAIWLRIVPAPRCRGVACRSAEDPAEVGLVTEAASDGNLRNTIVRPGHGGFTCLYACDTDIRSRRLAEAVAKQSTEVTFAKPDKAGELIH
jgi:hypothetical protein